MSMRRAASTTIDEQALLKKAAAWSAFGDCSRLTLENLQELSRAKGIDFATAVLYDRLCKSAEQGTAIRQIQDIVVPSDAELPQLAASVAIVPGAFYRTAKPAIGAAGQSICKEAARFGCPSQVVPLRSFGNLIENAQLLCDWLVQHATSDRPVVLVSLSKAGAEVKLALASRDAPRAFANVVAWINLSGLVCGTPLMAWLGERPLRTALIRLLFWQQGHDFSAVAQLDRGPGTLLDGALRLPAHLRAVHVVGFPLVCHLATRLSRRGHRRLAQYGPNDGIGNVLFDFCRLPGTVYPVWGADHYLRPDGADVCQTVRRVLLYLHETRVLADAREVALTGTLK